ncbi:hypothetical protein HK405_003803 [Cladochytrium tenue]|nr:hypothetical protein HK405_003803 [Cladochytrium tenue]
MNSQAQAFSISSKDEDSGDDDYVDEEVFDDDDIDLFTRATKIHEPPGPSRRQEKNTLKSPSSLSGVSTNGTVPADYCYAASASEIDFETEINRWKEGQNLRSEPTARVTRIGTKLTSRLQKPAPHNSRQPNVIPQPWVPAILDIEASARRLCRQLGGPNADADADADARGDNDDSNSRSAAHPPGGDAVVIVGTALATTRAALDAAGSFAARASARAEHAERAVQALSARMAEAERRADAADRRLALLWRQLQRLDDALDEHAERCGGAGAASAAASTGGDFVPGTAGPRPLQRLAPQTETRNAR